MDEKEGLQTSTFWSHIDDFRAVLIRIVVGLVIILPAVFFSKELLFSIILAPSKVDFITYRLFCELGEVLSLDGLCVDEIKMNLISTTMASQFMIHISTSIYVTLIIMSPYVIYQLYGFVAPALYDQERKYSLVIITSAFVLFASGVLLNYFVIFPLSFRFLATYQVAAEVTNMFTMSSYLGMFMSLSMMMGIVFEIPILTWVLAKMGIVSYGMMKKFRKHVIVAVLIIAAAITPTSDVVTLILVAAPIYLLYEFSMLIIKKSVKTVSAEQDSNEEIE